MSNLDYKEGRGDYYRVEGEREQLIADGRKWQAAEAEGHIVTFSDDGYGLQHPLSCRPNLIGCTFNSYLAERDTPDEEPGTYRMLLWDSGIAEYEPWTGSTDSEGR